jgi:hypothetical protein
MAHEGHPGVDLTLQRLQEAAWWTGASTCVRNKVSDFIACYVNADNNVTRSTSVMANRGMV